MIWQHPGTANVVETRLARMPLQKSAEPWAVSWAVWLGIGAIVVVMVMI